MAVMSAILCAREAEKGLASLEQLVDSRFIERPWLKKKGSQRVRHMTSISGHHTNAHT